MREDEVNDNQTGREGASIISDGQEKRREPIPASKPSQAEGDRETVEQDLREQRTDDHGTRAGS